MIHYAHQMKLEVQNAKNEKKKGHFLMFIVTWIFTQEKDSYSHVSTNKLSKTFLISQWNTILNLNVFDCLYY